MPDKINFPSPAEVLAHLIFMLALGGLAAVAAGVLIRDLMGW